LPGDGGRIAYDVAVALPRQREHGSAPFAALECHLPGWVPGAHLPHCPASGGCQTSRSLAIFGLALSAPVAKQVKKFISQSVNTTAFRWKNCFDRRIFLLYRTVQFSCLTTGKDYRAKVRSSSSNVNSNCVIRPVICTLRQKMIRKKLCY